MRTGRKTYSNRMDSRKVEKVEPYLQPTGPEPEKEYLVSNDEMMRLAVAMNCIMCGACVSDCTVLEVKDNFLGPAALAKSYRFIADPRDGSQFERLQKGGERLVVPKVGDGALALILGQELQAFDRQGTVPCLAHRIFLAYLALGGEQTTISQSENFILLDQFLKGCHAVEFAWLGLPALDLIGIAWLSGFRDA